MFATPTHGKRLQVKQESNSPPTSVFASRIKSSQIEENNHSVACGTHINV